jgi:hypothetical protein
VANPGLRALYARHELAFRTQYAEVCERCRNEGALLPGSPGSLALRSATGHAYWYRRYYVATGQQTEEFVGKDGDHETLEAMRARIEFAEWTRQQVRGLRQLGFQTSDKDVGRVLVELSNRGLFAAGLVMVGTLAYMAWLNELGVKAVASRTQDVDLARRQALKLAAPASFLEMVRATKLQFFPVPGLLASSPPTSVKRPGKEGLRVDVLTPGSELGQVVVVPELDWHAQTVPHYDYLLDKPRQACLLAGTHCIAVNVPAPERLVWHKLYSGANRHRDLAKADKDVQQACTLIAVLVECEDISLADSATELPAELFAAAQSQISRLRRTLIAHPQALEDVERTLVG